MAPKTAKGTTKKTKRAKKDPNAPKRALSSYMFFAKEKRAEIIAEKPELSKDVAAVGKMIGSAWNALSDKEKVPFEKMAEEDKLRYEKEKAAYEG